MAPLQRWLNAHYLNRRGAELSGLIALMVVLQLGAAVGIAYVAGLSAVRAVLDHLVWPWLLAVAGALAISFVGYYYAYRGVYKVEGGKLLDRQQMRAVVTGGFGGFFAHGGAALDEYAVEATGTSRRNAKARVASLAGLEHGVLALGGSAAAIAALAAGTSKPPADFTIPWAVIPVPGFVIAFWLAERYRDRLRPTRGWRRSMGIFLDSIHLVRELFRRPFDNSAAPFGMALFWAADIFCLWAAMAAFGFHMDVAALVIGYSTGMVFTRRTGPLAGAGVLMIVLPVTLWYSGAPFAAAVVGVFVYRVLTLWLPFPFAIATLGTLREIGKAGTPHAEGESHETGEPALNEGTG